MDECRGASGCSQGCVDTVGSFYCTCGAGYELVSDQRTCAGILLCACTCVCVCVHACVCVCEGRRERERIACLKHQFFYLVPNINVDNMKWLIIIFSFWFFHSFFPFFSVVHRKIVFVTAPLKTQMLWQTEVVVFQTWMNVHWPMGDVMGSVPTHQAVTAVGAWAIHSSTLITDSLA